MFIGITFSLSELVLADLFIKCLCFDWPKPMMLPFCNKAITQDLPKFT